MWLRLIAYSVITKERNNDSTSSSSNLVLAKGIEPIWPVIACSNSGCSKSFMRRAGGEVLPTGASLEVTSRLRNKVPQTFRFDDTVRLVVIENPHANVPLPDRRSNLQPM